jgi:hypothetical protein
LPIRGIRDPRSGVFPASMPPLKRQIPSRLSITDADRRSRAADRLVPSPRLVGSRGWDHSVPDSSPCTLLPAYPEYRRYMSLFRLEDSPYSLPPGYTLQGMRPVDPQDIPGRLHGRSK